jgi:hypothetical protein
MENFIWMAYIFKIDNYIIKAFYKIHQNFLNQLNELIKYKFIITLVMQLSLIHSKVYKQLIK